MFKNGQRCQIVIDVNETIAVAVCARLPTPALLAARGFTACRSHVTLARLVLRSSPRILEQERADCSQSRCKEILDRNHKIAQDCLTYM